MTQRSMITALLAVTVTLLAAWVVLGVAEPLVRLAFASASDEAGADASEREAFASGLARYRARTDGRSAFFDPPPPPPPPPPPAPPPAPVVNRAPAPPASYGGPAIKGIVDDVVWFAPDRKLRVGDDSDDSLRVISIDSPWSAEVEWKGVEFTVEFFERDTRLVDAEQEAEQARQQADPDNTAISESAKPEPDRELE